MSDVGPLRCVFFDVGGTLGVAERGPDGYRLRAFASSAALLTAMGSSLGLRIGVLSNTPDDMTPQAFRAMLDAAGLLTLLDPAAIITSADVGMSKPDARVYAYAAAAILIGRIAAQTSSCELGLDMGRRF